MTLALWILAAALLGLWTLAAVGLHQLLNDGNWFADLPQRLEAWLASLPWADRLDAWWPGWTHAMRLAAEITQSLAGWLGDGALWIVWGVWALGALTLVGATAVLTWLIGYGRRHLTPSPQAAERTAT